MVRVLIAGLAALLISILAGPRFIAFMRRKEYGQTIREEGPEHHVTKQGTPIMGGLLMLGAATAAYLAVARYTVPALTVFFVTLACGAIGFIDDFIKLTHRRSLGLNARWKLLLAIVGAALIGGLIGFLWYNAFPAEVFMGDTGSMAIGGALAAFAIMTKTIFLLLLVGGIFAIEALSVILQVFSFRYWGRRIFLMTPIHHHFEMKAWSETKIMVRFWIVTGLLCAAAFALYYRYFRGFR